MEKEIKIDSINVSIGKRELSLSMEEAKKLHDALSELFGKKVEHVHTHEYPYYRWSTPVTTRFTTNGVTHTSAQTSQELTLTNNTIEMKL